MSTHSESNPSAARNFSGIPAVPNCPVLAGQNKLPAAQTAGGAVPGWLDIVTKIAAPMVVIVVAAGLFNLVPELVRGTKDSINRIAAKIDFKANLSHQLNTAFR